MNTTSEKVQHALKSMLQESSPKHRTHETQNVLRQQSKEIKLAINAGWSATQIAKRLKQTGLSGSLASIRKEIVAIAATTPRQRRPKETERNASEEERATS